MTTPGPALDADTPPHAGPPHPWLRAYPSKIRWDAEIPVKSLPEMLADTVARWGGNVALDFLGYHLNYRELGHKVERFAAGLQQMGLKKGDRVGLFLPNGPHFVIAYYGILQAGGVVVNFNPLYSPREIAHQIHDSGVEVMVTLSLATLYDKLAPMLATTPLKRLIVGCLSEGLPFPKNLLFPLAKRKEIAAIPRDAAHVKFGDLLRTKQDLAPVAIDPTRDLALLQYTGGTTGVPKAAMLTHANLVANCVQCGHWFQGMEFGRERMMGVLPLFHVFAMTAIMNFSVYAGLTMILQPKFDMKTVLAGIQKNKPTLMCGVPTMFTAMNNYKSIGQYDLTSLKMCISGGAPLPEEVKLRFESITGCKLVEGYGLTESAPVACVNPLLGLNKTGTIGLPLPGTVLEIVSLEDGETVLGEGEVGEVCIRGPQVMQGYWNHAEETALVLRHGRLYTGDIGCYDADGYFKIVDRKKELIISGGYNIYPRQIEEALYTHPDIIEAAVVGVPHPQRGQVPKAYVVKRPESTLSEIAVREFLKEHLASYEVPQKVEFRDSLPKSMIGKILKKEL